MRIRFTDGERHVFRKRPYEPLSEWAAANLLVKDGPYAGGRYRKDVNPYLVEIMQTGIYALQYANDRDGGAGILVIMPDGKLAGGDHSFTYTGQWQQQGDGITAVLLAKKHRLAAGVSIFGPVEKLTIDGSGTIGGMIAVVTGLGVYFTRKHG